MGRTAETSVSIHIIPIAHNKIKDNFQDIFLDLFLIVFNKVSKMLT